MKENKSCTFNILLQVVALISIFSISSCASEALPESPPQVINVADNSPQSFVTLRIDEVQILSNQGEWIGEREMRLVIVGGDQGNLSGSLACPAHEPFLIQVGDTIPNPCPFGISISKEDIAGDLSFVIIAIDEDKLAPSADYSLQVLINVIANQIGKVVGKAVTDAALAAEITSLAGGPALTGGILLLEATVGYAGGELIDYGLQEDEIAVQYLQLTRDKNWFAGNNYEIISGDRHMRVIFSIHVSNTPDGTVFTKEESLASSTGGLESFPPLVITNAPASSSKATLSSPTPTLSIPTASPTKLTTASDSDEVSLGSERIIADNVTQILIPPGEFVMGSSTGNANETDHLVYLNAYWIDQTEVTNDQFSKFVAETNYITTAEQAGDGWTYYNGRAGNIDGANWQHPYGPNSSINNQGNYPVVLVSWNDANAYCRWRGGRLPTEAEWEKAAHGAIQTDYPWGNTFDCVKANLDDELEIDGTLVGSAGCDGYPRMAPAGSYPAGASPYNILDMSGNAWEWVADWYSETYYQQSPYENPQGPASGEQKVLRGGGWTSDENYSRTTYRSTTGVPSSRFFTVGFRCVASQ